MRSLLQSLIRPRDAWAACTPPTEAERLAAYERRLGEHRARQRLRDAAVCHVIDQHCAQRVQIRIVPRLPA